MAIETTGTGEQLIQDSDGESYVNGLSAFSITCWVKGDNLTPSPSDNGWFCVDIQSGTDNALCMRFDNVGANTGNAKCLKFGMGTTDISERNFETPSNTTFTTWKFIAWTWIAGEQPEAYVDGVLQTNSGYNSLASPGGTTVGAQEVALMVGVKDDPASESWDGQLQDFRIYNRKLTDEEISTMAALEGKDDIVYGLISRWRLNEGAPGVSATGTDSIKDSGPFGSRHMTDTGTSSPTYRESAIRIV
jgi:hypothetical protein